MVKNQRSFVLFAYFAFNKQSDIVIKKRLTNADEPPFIVKNQNKLLFYF
jgi:hypothetical protein